MNEFATKPPFNWICPVCAHAVIVSEQCHVSKTFHLQTPQSGMRRAAALQAVLIACPNAKCGSDFFGVRAFRLKAQTEPTRIVHVADETKPIGIGTFVFAPSTPAPLSPTIPKGVREDFNEAYLIRALSPKASATLARRALQGMIRDRWKVSANTLHGELQAIKEHCDDELYSAMMGLKSIGNIGAHPDKAADAMIDVDAGEPDELLQLIRILDDEWYVSRQRRNATLATVVNMADAKKQSKKSDELPAGPTSR